MRQAVVDILFRHSAGKEITFATATFTVRLIAALVTGPTGLVTTKTHRSRSAGRILFFE